MDYQANGDVQCEMGVYPFMFGAIKDFQPIADELIAVRKTDPPGYLQSHAGIGN